MTVYRTRDGDRLDQICWTHYGRIATTVEAVLAANRGLAALGVLLPAGVTIRLPELPEPITQSVRLWS